MGCLLLPFLVVSRKKSFTRDGSNGSRPNNLYVGFVRGIRMEHAEKNVVAVVDRVTGASESPLHLRAVAFQLK